MTRLEHSAELVGDIRDCAMRARDLGFTADSVDLCKVADQIEFRLTRDSLPPVLAVNQAARATASKHFQEARRLLRDIK